MKLFFGLENTDILNPTKAEKQARFAGALALTRTAGKVKQAVTQTMGDVFDRPKSFTMRAFRTEMARPANMEAWVFAMPVQGKYLRDTIEGGKRPAKGFERAIAGGRGYLTPIQSDQWGNIPRSLIRRVAAEKGASGRFFVGTPRGGGRGFGVWERKNGNKRLVQVMNAATSVAYERRFKFDEVAQFTVEASFHIEFSKAFSYAMATAR